MTMLDRIQAEIKNRWIDVPEFDRSFRTDPARLESISQSVLDAMLSRFYRVRKRPDPLEYDQLLKRVQHWVTRSRPIQIRLGYAPAKNPNAVAYVHCDWAEFFAFSQLAHWHRNVASVYPPGIDKIRLRISRLFRRGAGRFSSS